MTRFWPRFSVNSSVDAVSDERLCELTRSVSLLALGSPMGPLAAGAAASPVAAPPLSASVRRLSGLSVCRRWGSAPRRRQVLAAAHGQVGGVVGAGPGVEHGGGQGGTHAAVGWAKPSTPGGTGGWGGGDESPSFLLTRLLFSRSTTTAT
ncbi:unnamed protein product [Merluccius merluccius]